jgi:FMN reductase
VVTVSGTLHSPSKTGTLLTGIVTALTEQAAITADDVDLLSLGHPLIDALGGAVSPELAEQLERVASSDLLVVATPVYKGSYTGLLKLFVDLLGQDALRGRPVILAATGGSDHHSLVIEHELRPLFGFFRAHTVPTGIYARGADFTDGALSEPLRATIADAVAQALRIVETRTAAL